MQAVTYDVLEGIAFVTLNRPERLNAISSPLLDGLLTALEKADADAGVDVVLLRANGRAFCAGDDLAEFAEIEISHSVVNAFVDRLQDVTRRIMFASKPVVCAAQGWIVGGGAAWPLNADFTIVADDATMFCPEAGYGLFPSGGATILLSERCGPAVANEVLWLGLKLPAERLKAHRIVDRVVPRGDLANESLALARQLRALPAVSRQRYKRARVNDIRERLESALAFEARCCKEAPFDPQVRERTAKALAR